MDRRFWLGSDTDATRLTRVCQERKRTDNEISTERKRERDHGVALIPPRRAARRLTDFPLQTVFTICNLLFRKNNIVKIVTSLLLICREPARLRALRSDLQTNINDQRSFPRTRGEGEGGGSGTTLKSRSFRSRPTSRSTFPIKIQLKRRYLGAEGGRKGPGAPASRGKHRTSPGLYNLPAILLDFCSARIVAIFANFGRNFAVIRAESKCRSRMAPSNICY